MAETEHPFEAGKVLLYINGELISSEETSTGETLLEGSILYVGSGATARETHLGTYDEETGAQAGGKMFVDSGGKIGGLDVQTGGLFSGNGALASKNEAWYGAAICGTGGTIALTGGTFSENRANELNGMSGLGGAIETWGGTLSADGTRFSQNTAAGSKSAGGAICAMNTETVFSGAVFEQNKAFYGGAFQQQGGRSEITGSVFSGNSAVSEDPYSPAAETPGLGGALEFHQGAAATVSGSRFDANTAENGGAIYMDSFSGAVSSITISGGSFSGNTAIRRGGAIFSEAELSIDSAFFANNSAGNEGGYGEGGALANSGGTLRVSNCVFSGNRAQYGGAVWNNSSAALTVIRGCTFSGNVSENGGAILNESEMLVSDTVFSTESDTILNRGKLRFSGASQIGGQVVNEGLIELELSAVNAMTAGLDTSRALVDSLQNFTTGGLTISTGSVAEDAVYLVAAHTGNFTGSLTLAAGGKISEEVFFLRQGQAAPGDTLFWDGKYCTLGTGEDADGCLTLKIMTTGQVASQDEVAWNDFSGPGGYEVQFSRDSNFFGFITLHTDGTRLALNNLSPGEWHWRIRGGVSEVWAQGKIITAGEKSGGGIFRAKHSGVSDIFFAQASGVWNGTFRAVHEHTGETVETSGKNRFHNAFSGSGNANILYLTDDARGDALFQDDIYSRCGGTGRLDFVREIRAGGGNDLIDLTSRCFRSGLDGITVRGGEGDDILWGADPDAKLFGDAGNDVIRGGTGDDWICGGGGDDTLSGGGGNDIFAFGGIWGNDEIGQDPSGHVTLLFGEDVILNEYQDSDTVLTDGLSSVTLTGGLTAGDVTILSGPAALESEQYSALKACGAFLSASSGNVFEHEPFDGVPAGL